MTKEKFLKVYANLPESERSQVIVIIDDKPYSWNVAYIEISSDTQLGKKIVKKMESMGIL